MFDIAFSELIVIAVIALVVLGPKRLPEVARTAGRWAGALRRFVENAKRDMDTELRREDLAELRSVKQQLDETRQTLEQSAGAMFRGTAAAASPDYLLRALDDSAPAANRIGSPRSEAALGAGKRAKKPARKRAAPKPGKRPAKQAKAKSSAKSRHGRVSTKRR